MADIANDLIAGAMGAGYAGLSSHQCWMCLLALYAGGLRADEAIAGAQGESYSTLSDQDIQQSILYALQ
jgi:hypothetical protein